MPKSIRTSALINIKISPDDSSAPRALPLDIVLMFPFVCFKVKVFPEEELRSDKYMATFLNGYFRFLNFLGMGMGRGECQVIRKSTYNKVGGYRKDLHAGEDFELFTRIRRQGKVLFINDFVVYESPRRYHKLGYLKILTAWFLNSSTSLIFKKSFYKSWDLVR